MVKEYRKKGMLYVFFILLMIAGCGSNNSTLVSQSTQTNTQATPSAIKIYPTRTFTPANTRTPTRENIVTPTFVELSAGERQKAFLRGFSPPICDLPCLGNIKPGITTKELILSDLYDIGLYPAIYDTYKNLLTNTIEIENPITETDEFSVLFEVQLSSTVIDSIYIEGSSPQDLRYFNEVWQYYEIDKVLDRHGQPDQIVLWIDPSSSPSGKYRLFSEYLLFLFYEKDGFVIGYQGLAESETSDGDFTLCPKEPKLGFSVGSIDPQKHASLDHFMYRAIPYILSEKRLDFTESTGLSIHSFQDFILSNSSESKCLRAKR